MIRTATVHHLLLRIKSLAAYAVVAAVFTEVDVALIVYLLQDVLHHLYVIRVRRPDEAVVGEAQLFKGRAEHPGDAVNVGLGLDAFSFGRLHYLIAVLVGACQKVYVGAESPPEPGQGIGQNGRIRVADVRLGVHVVDRRGYVIRLFLQGFLHP